MMNIKHTINEFIDSYDVTQSELFCALEEHIENNFRVVDIGISKTDGLFRFHIATDFELLLDELKGIEGLGFDLVREKHLRTVHHYHFQER